ncbi:hypothetical protein XENOCAPTIV_017550, partial [Xenoophorus captivus]
TLNSTCAITDYLKNHLPPMINNLTLNNTIKAAIINDTGVFQYMFESLATLMNKCQDKDKLMECPRELPTLKRLLPNNCSTPNITEDIGLKHQPLSAHHLSSISCYMQKLSQLPQIPELSEKLMTDVQIIQDTKRRLFNSTTPTNCSLPAFEQELDAHKFAGCFLQLVEKDLSS